MISIQNPKSIAVITTIVFLGLCSPTFAQGDSWATKSSLPTPRALSSACELNGIIYVIGGTTTNDLSSLTGTTLVEAYDPATDTWEEKADLTTRRKSHGNCKVNGKIYVIGGQTQELAPYLSIVEEYDPEKDEWAVKSPMPTARAGMAICAVADKVYAIGGFEKNGDVVAVTTVEVYDPVADAWTTKAPMPTARGYIDGGASVVAGKIYVIGGAQGFSGALSMVEEYDPSTDTWTQRASLPTARNNLTTSVVNGKIYAIGGAHNGYPNFNPVDAVEEYDPVTDSWTSRTAMPQPRVALCSSTVDGKIYVFGGSYTGNPFHWAVEVVEYTPPDNPTAITNRSGNQNIPARFVLHQNHPNPFNPSTEIRFELPHASHVNLAVFNALGQKVRPLVDQNYQPGSHSVRWDGRDENGTSVGSGVYFYQLQAGSTLLVKKMSLIL